MKKDLDPQVAAKIANEFIDKTKDLYAKYALAGSLRRREPVVHDIDIAVIPKESGGGFEKWKEDVRKRVQGIGGSVRSIGDVITNFDYREVQVNLFICPGLESWGVTLMWATGPTGHTIGMTIKARNRNLLINSRGIWTRDEPPRPVRARTEEEVGKILGWRYKAPESRGKSAKKGGPSALY